MSNSVNAHGASTEASPLSRAPADQGAGRGREQGEDLSSGHPIHPPSSTSTRDADDQTVAASLAGTETMDGWRSVEEIRRLCDEATPGPWFVASREGDDEGWWIWADPGEPFSVDPFTVALLAYDGPDGGQASHDEREKADAEFIAAARDLVPQLLAEVEAAHRFEQSVALDSARVAAVEDLIEQARKVSPSAAMTVYVGDLEKALGRRADNVRGIRGAES